MRAALRLENTRFACRWMLGWTVALAAVAGAADGAPITYVVSPTGSDKNPGTLTQPFKTVQRGVNVLAPGDRLVLRAGHYVGSVLVKQKLGQENAPIVIMGAPGESVSIDGYLSMDEGSSGQSWQRASLYDAEAHPEEFVSTRTFSELEASDRVNRGAFLEVRAGVPVDRHTRLMTYARLEDLRAENQTWEKMKSPGPEGESVTVYLACSPKNPEPACQALPDCDPYPSCAPTPPKLYMPAGYSYPTLYMGPGLWFDRATGRVHVRLSHTNNEVKGLADYRGDVDPRLIALAIARKEMYALRVDHSSHIHIKNLDIRFGGEQTIELDHVTGVTFDHVRIWAGTRAVTMAVAAGVAFKHCLFDGGLPEWSFRNDLKDEYLFLNESTGLIELNGRGNTTDTLLLGSQSGADQGTVIEYSEFVNGHDLYLQGTGLQFHHNWIRNLNDEALFLDAYPLTDAHIHENLIERSLSGISMAGDRGIGARYVYRNVFDLREPTAGYRPRNQEDRNVWRYGHAFKSSDMDGPLDLFHNTFIVQNQDEAAAYMHMDSKGQIHPRRSFNNIFLAVNAEPAANKNITFLPDPNSPFVTDGNDYFRFGFASTPPYRHREYECGNQITCRHGTFASLDGPALPRLRGSVYFERSRLNYAPGFEASSLEVDPQFESFSWTVGTQATDDFRLSAGSPLRGAAIPLPTDLGALDPYAGAAGASDIGSCPHGSAPLRVGIDGRRVVGQPY